MRISKFEKYDCGVYIPNWMIDVHGIRTSYATVFDVRTEEQSIEFDLPDDRWIIMVDNDLIRYRKSDDEKVRKQYFDYCLNSIKSVKPYEATRYLLSAARLIHVDLSELVRNLGPSSQQRSYADVYAKLINLK